MALFNRNKKKDVLPQEVREYYQAERRDRTGMAWLLAIATLLVTFLIAAALFFGGRWAYRAIFDNDNTSDKTSTSQTENKSSEESSKSTENNTSTNDGQSGQTGSSNSGNAANSNGTNSESGQTSSTNTTTNPGTGSTSTGSSNGSVSGTSTTGNTATSNTPATTPVTGEATELVNTGTGDMIAIYALVVIGSALAHYVVVANRRS